LATRVFELARSLGVTSKTVLEKCRAEGLNIKNHMSTVSAGLEATIREWFSEEGLGTAVETTEHVDLENARKEASKRKRKAPEPSEEPKEAPVEKAAAVAEAPEESETDEAPAEAPAPPTAVAKPATEQVEAPEAPPVEPETPEAPPTEPETEEAPAEEPGEEPAPAVAEAEPVAEGPDEAEEQEPEEGEEDEGEGLKPMGPQVVPKPAQLKGPRVVRVERPDYVPRPRPQRRPPRQRSLAEERDKTIGRKPRGGAPDVERAPDRKTKTKGKSKRRSPRRRSGRSADSGERIKEWRNQDLAERSARLAAAGGGLRRHRANVRRGRGDTGPVIEGGPVDIEEPITVKSLSAATGLKVADILKKMLGLGMMGNINTTLERDAAEAIVSDYGFELNVREMKTAEDEMLAEFEQREAGEKIPRAPVVTFLGHVDHGKTSLLDHIRQTTVTEGEAGGITQHIGAYRYDKEGRHVVFLDTPGHEAFTAMRARGANMTDIIVLVVAADDGVMPQTAEAINHAKAAKVPIVVALNKIDVPNANVQRALGQLAEHELMPREWGGDTEVIHTSAITGEGVDDLVETLSLEAELLELKAEPDAPATGFVIEAEMDPGRGAVTRLLVKNGTMRLGDIIVAGQGYGRLRSIQDDRGRDVEAAGPATPVEVSGLNEIPSAGDRFYQVEDLDRARDVAEQRQEAVRQRGLAGGPKARSLEALLSQIEAGESHELPLIIKADVQGSIEAITGSLDKLNTEETRVNVLHAGVGGISTGDVTLAEASDAIILGFNAVADASARQLAETKGVNIRLYRVIYDLIEDMKTALEKGLAPEIREETLGRAEIRQTFKVSRLGTIAGCYVTDGVVQRNAKLRIIRDSVVVEDERTLDSLKRFKDDAREVRAGLECGLKVAGYDDIKEGDILEFYKQVEVARTL
jgi:translation initiation factor IF-2